MGWTSFLLTYLLGGITFIPLVIVVVFSHAYLTLPYREESESGPSTGDDSLVQPGDDLAALKDAQKEKEDSKPRPNQHEPDVAAGYFAVCREYTPMGINAKPIERSTPVGSTTVAAPSPSVYQTMYRSIFDRKQAPGPLDNKNGTSQRPKKAGNVFYVVLRHGHMMLFDDDEQLEVRHVISLAHHDVSLYSGGDTTPEGELFIKRNAICLSRRPDGAEIGPDSQLSKPFYLFSENCSAKEDFYFALLRNQEQGLAGERKAPRPLGFDVKNVISLVQKLHSSEEHLQTRWLNALIGRVFLGIYKTPDLENYIRKMITKKISRVKKPSFLSNITIKKIDTGEAAPYFTNPRLKDLTVEGECGVEADVRYTGNFRIEVAATARIDLGTRFKAREVSLLLAVVVRKVEGHVLFKIKPPPSNRIWFTFQQMPKLEMTIEPIVSQRQITYTVILRQIENRIKEVISETLVLPFWDDLAFFRTEHKHWRGGIFDDDAVATPADPETIVAQEGEVDEVDKLEGNGHISDLPPMEKSQSLPVIENTHPTGLFGRKLGKRANGASSPLTSASSKSAEILQPSPGLVPTDRPAFSESQPSLVESEDAAHDAASIEVTRPSPSPGEHPGTPDPAEFGSVDTGVLKDAPSPAPIAAAFKPYVTSRSSNNSSASSREATDTEKDLEQTPTARRNTASSAGSIRSHDEDGSKRSSPLQSKGSLHSQTGSIKRGFFARRDTSMSNEGSPGPSSPGTPDQLHQQEQKRNTIAAVSNAAATAKRWGWNAIQRHNEARNAKNQGNGHHPYDLNQPMGRGQPLPPPGMPLPMPDKKNAPIGMPKRKPVPPPLPARASEVQEPAAQRRPVPPPPLPNRRSVGHEHQQRQDPDDGGDSMLVVAAPADSEPSSPMVGDTPDYVPPSVEDAMDDEDTGPKGGVRDVHERDASPPLLPHDSEPQEHHDALGMYSDEHHDEHHESAHDAHHASGSDDANYEGEEDEEDDGLAAWMERSEESEPTSSIVTSEGLAQ